MQRQSIPGTLALIYSQRSDLRSSKPTWNFAAAPVVASAWRAQEPALLTRERGQLRHQWVVSRPQIGGWILHVLGLGNLDQYLQSSGRKVFVEQFYRQQANADAVPDQQTHDAEAVAAMDELGRDAGLIKRGLASSSKDDIEAYRTGKHTFVEEMTAKARAWRADAGDQQQRRILTCIEELHRLLLADSVANVESCNGLNFDENVKREEMADSYGASRATAVTYEFSVGRQGPSDPYIKNAPTARRIFDHLCKTTFATISARNGRTGMVL